MDRRIQDIVTAFETDLARRWTIEAMARRVRLSVSRFRHLFKTETGTTPSQYLKLLRLRKAEMLLCTTYRSVKEIRHGVGINDESYFSREFKKLYGASPTDYRTPRAEKS